jgi:hypothetical protein
VCGVEYEGSMTMEFDHATLHSRIGGGGGENIFHC